jgi:dipeptidyl aminopeptidase/acylaminoacyl peptidase
MLGLLPGDIGRFVSPSDPRLSPDGSLALLAVQRVDLDPNRYHTRIWCVPTDARVPAAAISPVEESACLARWSPDGTQLAYTARRVDDDDAVSEIFVAGADGGDRRAVCVCPSEPGELEWSPDGTHLAFVARDPDPARYGAPGEPRKEKDMPARRIERLFTRLDSEGWINDRPLHVFVVAVDGASPARLLTPGSFEAGGAAWSPDGRRIAFTSGRHDEWDLDWAVDLFVVDAFGDAASPTRISETGPIYSLPSWSPDGTRIACLRQHSELEGPWNGRVVVFPMRGGSETVLTEALDRNCAPHSSTRGPLWSDDRLLFLVEDRGRVHISSVDAGGGACSRVVEGERVITGFDKRGEQLVYVAIAPDSVPELFVSAAGAETRLTDFTGELTGDDRTIAVPRHFVASPAPGVDVDCWIIEPEHEPGTRVPLLLNIHGGPFSHYGSRFFDEFQFEVGAGFGVLFCNPRGSSSYTEAWGRAIRWPECKVDPGSAWGGVDYDDIMECVDEAMRRNDWIDPERLGVIGGSYGGYMTSWIIGHNGRFAAAVSERGVNNLLTLDHGSDIAGSFVSYVGVRHIDDPDAYLRQSPISFVTAMRTPLLIVHSEDDLRCPVNQAEELFVALRLLGRTPEFVRFPGESHELSRSGAPRHRVERAEVILDFFHRHLAPSN